MHPVCRIDPEYFHGWDEGSQQTIAVCGCINSRFELPDAFLRVPVLSFGLANVNTRFAFNLRLLCRISLVR